MYRNDKVALEEAGSCLENVVRTRMLQINIEDWAEIAKVRGEFFKDIKPVDTVVEVSRVINPDWLVEIEIEAVVGESE